MSKNPEERNRDSKKAGKEDLTKAQPEPIDKQDPTEPVEAKNSKGKSKAPADMGLGDAAAIGKAGP